MLEPGKRSKTAAALSIVLALIMLVAGFTTACSPAAKAAEKTDKHQPTVIEQASAEPADNTELTSTPTAVNPAYEAPDKWKESFEQGTLQINVDADVIVPKVASIPTYEVDPNAVFSQDAVIEMVKVFYADAQVYQASVPAKEQLNLKFHLANKDIILMEIGAFDFPDDWDEARKNTEIENTKLYRSSLMDQIKNAPGEPELVPFDHSFTYDEYGIALMYCYADLGGEEPAKLWIRNSNRGASAGFEDNGGYMGINVRLAQATPVGDLTISKEDAKIKADELLSSLGLNNFKCVSNYISGKVDYRYKQSKPTEKSYAHTFIYSRNIDGIQVSADNRGVINVDEKTSFKLAEYQPETILITVNDKGVRDFKWENMFRTGNMAAQNVKLLPFGEISGIIGRKICKLYEGTGDTLSNETGRGTDWLKTEKYILAVDKIILEYARMPLGSDLDTQVLLPVWSVYATNEWQFWKLNNGEKYLNSHKDPLSHCILTVNAMDGSIIGEN